MYNKYNLTWGGDTKQNQKNHQLGLIRSLIRSLHLSFRCLS